MITHDEMTPTDMTAPAKQDEPRAAPITSAKAQQAISAANVVQPDTTPTLEKAQPIQEAPAPRAAGGNLVMQGTNAPPVPAVPMAQSQAAPQILTSVSTMKSA